MIPRIDTERERGNHQMLQAENLFNPILWESWEAYEASKKKKTECKCDSKDPDDFYPTNKKRCKYCVSRNIGAEKRRKYATCDCGVTGETNFYHYTYKGVKKLRYPCKQCKKKKCTSSATITI